MATRIVIGGYERLLALARKALQEMSVPSDIGIEYIETHQFLKTDSPPQLESTDLLVCGYQTALALEHQYNIKSLPIRITGFDLLQAISEALQYSKEITILNFHENIPEIDKYSRLLKVTLDQREFTNINELKTILLDLKAQGCRVVIGSSLVCEEAEKSGLQSVFIYSANNIRETLRYAVQMVSSYFAEKERAETLKSLLDYTHSGIIGMGPDLRISTFNPAAEKILGLTSREVLGRSLDSIFPDLKLKEENGNFIPKINQLWRHRKKLMIFSSVPIKADGRYFGQVTVLQDNETIRNAEEKIRRDLHHKRFVAQYSFKDIAGGSTPISYAIEKAKIFAKSDSAVLILGETGTGKELFAQSVHNLSRRCNRPFVSINCGALTESLLDSELFGYEKGSFTGARSEGKIGLFEMAHTGTIFLDEVGEILPSVQVRLLRVIQEKEVMRVGGDRLIPVDVRIIAATNKNLWDLVRQGKFREDLYYRLNVLELYIPPLRERPEDIPELARAMLTRIAPYPLHSGDSMMAKTIPLLMNYDWPGNIRELENIIERFSILVQDKEPSEDLYKKILLDCFQSKTYNLGMVIPSAKHERKKRTEIPKEDILRALHASDGKKTHAAKKLGISRITLYRILRDRNLLS